MALNLRFNVVGPKFSAILRDKTEKQILTAALNAIESVKQDALAEAKSNIASAGNFGSRWTEGLTAEVTNNAGVIDLTFSHAVPYFMVFQKGQVIRGKPFLAIPLSFATDAKGIFARNFAGGLFRVDRKLGKAPLLLSLRTKQPKYFLKESVTIPKKFSVLEIIQRISKTLSRRFLKELKNG